jgi:hypothetical protein
MTDIIDATQADTTAVATYLIDFVGNDHITALLQEQVANYVPYAFQASLNCVQWEETFTVLDRYRGDFIYVHARSGMDYSVFMVRAERRIYIFRLPSSSLPIDWEQSVPSRWA